MLVCEVGVGSREVRQFTGARRRWEVSGGLLYLRVLGPSFLWLCSHLALWFVSIRMASPRRGFMLTVWGNGLLFFAFSTANAALVWANETPAQRAHDTPSMLLVGMCAMLSCALGLALGWRIRVEGERFLIAIARPPASVNSRSLRSSARVPMGLLWLTLVLGAFAATYSMLSHLTP